MNWNHLTTTTQISELIALSEERPVIIFKHSTRCGISSMVKRRFEKDASGIFSDLNQFYYLDLIKYRDVSNAIAEQFNVQHESPQIILLHNGTAIYNASHHNIDAGSLEQQMQIAAAVS